MSRLIEKAMEKSSASECYILNKSGTEVEFENNKLKGINDGQSSGKALRVVCGEKIGFSTSTKNDDSKLLSSAIDASKYGRSYDFKFTDKNSLSEIKCFYEDVEEYPVEKMVDIGKEIVGAIKEYDRQILAFASISKLTKNVKIVNSEGVCKEYRKSSFSVVGGGKITEEGNFLQLYDYKIANSIIGKVDIENITKKVIADFNIAKINVGVKSANFPVLISPKAVSDIITPIIVCSNGKNIQKGVSPWRDKVGDVILDKRISIYDDGTVEKGVASIPFDDEGVPTSKTAIIENGILKGYIHNLATAYALNMNPTGNGMRGGGIETIPNPGTTNLLIDGGEISFIEMLKGIKKGILIDELLGTFTSNHLAGNVSGNISLGYKIENGEIVGRVKDAVLSFNVFEVLKNNIKALSKEVFWQGSHQFPYVLLDDIFISTKAV